MATEKEPTLRDMRDAAKAAKGVLIGGWRSPDQTPLLKPLQEMADDIISWLNPSQGWHLVEVVTGFINPLRIAESVDTESPVKIKARKYSPDQFTPAFDFAAERPPTKKTGLVKRREVLDFPRVFDHRFRDRVDIAYYTGANVYPDHIGPIYPLQQALKELSSPYYLVGATVNVNYRDGLTVMVYSRDLIDQVRVEINRLRRAQRKLAHTFQ